MTDSYPTTLITGNVSTISSSTESYAQDSLLETGDTFSLATFNALANATATDGSINYLDSTFGVGWLDTTTSTSQTSDSTYWVGGSFLRTRNPYQVTSGNPTVDDAQLTISPTGLSTEFYRYGGVTGVMDANWSDGYDSSLSGGSDPPESPVGGIDMDWFRDLLDNWIKPAPTDLTDNINAGETAAQWDVYAAEATQTSLSSDAIVTDALTGAYFLNSVQGNTFSWADGYDFNWFTGYTNFSLGNDDAVVALSVSDMIAYTQKSIEVTWSTGTPTISDRTGTTITSENKFQGGAWPKMDMSAASAVRAFDGETLKPTSATASGETSVVFDSAFNVTNGPASYKPDSNFATRTFGSTWGTVTGNQVVFGTGSGDFNLGPTLEFNYRTRTGNYEIEITEGEPNWWTTPRADISMVAKLYKPPFYTVTAREDVETSDIRKALVARGIAESYTVIPAGEWAYSYSRGNTHEIHIEDPTGSKRSMEKRYDGKTIAKGQKDKVCSRTMTTYNEVKQIVEGNIFEKDTTGINFGIDVTGANFAMSSTGFTLKGPLKAASGWEGYLNPDKWEAQGLSADFQLGPWLKNTSIGIATTSIDMKVLGFTPAMHLKWDWSSAINSTEIEFCGGGFDTHLSIFYKEVELGASFLSNVVAGNAASVKAAAEAKTRAGKVQSDNAPAAIVEGLTAKQDALAVKQTTVMGVLGAIKSNISIFRVRG